MIKILIMGLPGSGKTTLAEHLVHELLNDGTVTWFNADITRAKHNDWDFSMAGRKRQVQRLNALSHTTDTNYVVCDFIAPTVEIRDTFDADYTVWMDTITESRFTDTNALFVNPTVYNYRITSFDIKHIVNILSSITGSNKNFDILENIQVPEFANKHTDYIGIDSPDKCLSKQHFHNYKNPINYEFNSRGFRDIEWPNAFHDVTWCIGDSFTVGLGQPFSETWTQQLDVERTINISMVGASNQWITKHTVDILKNINPKNIIIQWSHLHRRENEDVTLSDFNRIVHYDGVSEPNDDINNFIEGITQVELAKGDTNIIHSFIPLNIKYYPMFVKTLRVKFDSIKIVDNNITLDHARDYYHYDIKTAKRYCEDYINLIV